MAAGAVGFSTSRTLIHKGIDGEHVPGTFAEEPELFGIGRAMRRAGVAVLPPSTGSPTAAGSRRACWRI